MNQDFEEWNLIIRETAELSNYMEIMKQGNILWLSNKAGQY